MLLGSSGADATPPPGRVTLAWTQDDPTCIGEADLAATVERTLARSVFQGTAPAYATVVGAIGKGDADRFQARITLADRGGAILATRELTTTGDCKRLDESAAVVVAIMIDSFGPPVPLAIPPTPPRLPPPPSTSAPAALQLALDLGGGVSSSFLPAVNPMAVLRGELTPRRFVPLGLTMRAHAPAQALVNGSGGTFISWTGELSVCPVWARPSLRLGVCGGFGAGLIAGSPVGLRDGHNPVRPVVLASLLPYGALRIAGPIWVRAEAGAWFPLLRERWGYLENGTRYTEVHRPGAAVPIASLALEFRTGS